MPFRFQLAGPEHECGLRQLLAEESMPGPIRLAFTREPDFFQGLALEGPFTQAFVALEDQEIVGMGTRAIRPCYVNGKKQDLGYLGGLRVRAAKRRYLGFSKGYRLLREIHQDGRCPAYLSTILDSNGEAKKLLLSHRAGLPKYLDLGQLHSHLLLLNHRMGHPSEVRRAEDSDASAVLRFLAEHGPRRQFFPVLNTLSQNSFEHAGFAIQDFRLLEKQGRIEALLAIWDQRAHRQLRVDSYAPWLRLLRPFLNECLRVMGFGPLPFPGEKVALASVSFLATADDDPHTLQRLLKGSLAGLSHSDLLGLGLILHDRDPLRPALGEFRSIHLSSHLYGVGWEESESWFQTLNPALIPYMDPGML